MSPKKHRGFIGTEGVLILISLSMIIVTFFAVVTILNPSRAMTTQGSRLLESYQHVLESMNRDFRFAQSVEIASQSMILRFVRDRVVVYRLDGSSLLREDGAGRPLMLLENLASGQFRKNPELPTLVSVYLLPSDQMGVPFFTSFALRSTGSNGVAATGGQR